MNVKTIAAAMKLALYAQENEGDATTDTILKEMNSFNLSEEDKDTIVDLYKKYTAYEVVEILHNSDDATKKEAHALAKVTAYADGELTDGEVGKLVLLKVICDLPSVSLEEAHEILGF